MASHVNIAPLADRWNQVSGPDSRNHMDYARHLLFESAVARAAVGTRGGFCSVRDLVILAVAPTADASSSNRAGARGRCLVAHHRSVA